jgi:DnaJ like chaperone protein
MSLIVVGALLGLYIAGIPGLVVGGVLGYAIGRGSRAAFVGVSSEEIRVAEQIFERLHLSAEQRIAAKAAFNRGKAPDFDLDGEAGKLASLRFGRAPLLRLFLQVQCMAVAADGNVHPAEHAMLVRVARRLGLGERDVAQLEALLRAAHAGPSSAGGPPPAARLDDAYTALGIDRNASVAEIKRAYRRLIGENHPDKLAARGMPDSMREVAEERAREINVAYDLIKDDRQFS